MNKVNQPEKKESRQALGSFPEFIYVFLLVQFKTISSTNI